MKRNAILVVDVGSSKVRASLIDLDNGKTIGSERCGYCWESPEVGWLQTDPAHIWDAAEASAASLLNNIQSGEVQIYALVFSFIGDSFLAVDEDGKPIYPLLCSGDNRARNMTAVMKERLGESGAFGRITGSAIDQTYVPLKILWLQENRPDIFRNMAGCYSIQQYFLSRLGCPAIYDYSIGARSMMMNTKKAEWSPDVMKVVGVKAGAMGKICPSTYCVGETDRIGNAKLPGALPVIIGGHDALCSFIGLGVLPSERQTLLAESAGSWDLVGFIPKTFYRTDERYTGLHIGLGPDGKSYHMMGSTFSGPVMHWFVDEISADSSPDAWDSLFKRARFDGTGRVALKGSFPNGRAQLTNLSTHDTVVDLFTGIVEGLTYPVKFYVDEFNQIAEGKIQALRIGSGGAKADAWNQFKADLMGMPVERVANIEASSVGAAMLAAVGIEYYANLEMAAQRMVRCEKIYLPRPEIHNRYVEKYHALFSPDDLE